MTENKIETSFQIGELRVEYKGESSFFEEKLMDLMKKYIALYGEYKGVVGTPSSKGGESSGEIISNEDKPSNENQIEGSGLSTSEIALGIKAKKLSELIIAAVMHLTFSKSQKEFTRKEINNEIKNVTNLYKETMGNNLKRALKSLVSNKILNKTKDDTYAIHVLKMDLYEEKYKLLRKNINHFKDEK